MSSDRRQEDRVPVSVRVRLQYPDVDTFVERYATNVSRGGIFVQSQRTQPQGTLIRFEFQLQDKQAVIRGEGRVAWSVPFDPAHPERTYGMGVRFTRLEARSKKLIDDMVAQRVARGERDPGMAPPSPETARTEESLHAPEKPRPAEARPAPAPRAQKPDLGPMDPAPVRDLDPGMTDVAVDVRALLERTLGRDRIAASEADALLAELSKGVDLSRARAVTRGAALRPRPGTGGAAGDGARTSVEPKARPAEPKSKPPEPKHLPGERRQSHSDPAPPAAVAAPPAPAPEAIEPQEDSRVKRVIRDLFEDSDVSEAPVADEERAQPLPELQEVPPAGVREGPEIPVAAVAAPEAPQQMASLFDEDEPDSAFEDMEAAPPAGAPPAAKDESRPSFPEVEASTLSALDEPLLDDFDSRPSAPPPHPVRDVDLDQPIYDDFDGSVPAPAAQPDGEVASLLADLGDDEPPSDAPTAEDAPPAPAPPDDAPVPILPPEDPSPKKGFFKKLFGK